MSFEGERCCAHAIATQASTGLQARVWESQGGGARHSSLRTSRGTLTIRLPNSRHVGLPLQNGEGSHRLRRVLERNDQPHFCWSAPISPRRHVEEESQPTTSASMYLIEVWTRRGGVNWRATGTSLGVHGQRRIPAFTASGGAGWNWARSGRIDVVTALCAILSRL